MRTIILELTYRDDVDADTLQSLLDSHSEDEGLVDLRGRLAHATLFRPINLAQSTDGGPPVAHFAWGKYRTYCGLPLEMDMQVVRPGTQGSDAIVCGDCSNAMEQMP